MLSKCSQQMALPMSRSVRLIFHTAPKSFASGGGIPAWRANFPELENNLKKFNVAEAPKTISVRVQEAAPVKVQEAAPLAEAPAIAHNVKTSLLDGYGKHSFKGATADRYLAEVGLPAGTIEAGAWHKDKAKADKVAKAVLKWATDHDASVFCHWFQPLGGSGVRHGLSGQVQNAFFNFNKAGVPEWDLKGKDLIQGETDGSSYPSGGLRATHTAGGYVTIDPTSPMWLRGDTVFIPAAFMTYRGHAIDEKTPLLRSAEALNREGARLLSLLGYQVSGLSSHIGLQQEFFLVPRRAYMQRLDLQMAGRTVMGMDAPRGQEMCDHYMGPPSLGSSAALACMQEIQHQCYKLGIPLKTRHREVAPNQFEFAPYFGPAPVQIDQNIMVMQVIEEVASTYGLAALLQEKPFNNVNGSGKHNNWSLITSGGVNLLNVNQINKASGNADVFPVIMSAIISAVDTHGDLMRLAIASPGNDLRLGACEAPPAIVSTYLGEDLTNFLMGWKSGKRGEYQPGTKEIDTGAGLLAPVIVPSEDRNRTSPFPYGGHRFEFRAVGSSQNVSIVNTVLNTMCAAKFKEFADAIEGKSNPREVASKALNDHWKVIFNGNNYDESAQRELTAKGVWRIDSNVDAMCRFTHPKNVRLFSSMGVLSAEECHSRQDVMLEHYIGSVEIEVKCMIQMLNEHVIPSVRRAGVGPTVESFQDAVNTLQNAMKIIHAEENLQRKAEYSRMLRLEDMIDIRRLADEAEAVVPADLWTLSTYKDLLFLDQTTE
jgi:glutamine synthetase